MTGSGPETGHAIRFVDATVEETLTLPEWPRGFDRLPPTGRRPLRLSGKMKAFADPPASMLSKERTTDGFAAVLTERRGVTLASDLTVLIERGGDPVTIPAGTVVDSFLIHWDPPWDTRGGPSGRCCSTGRSSGSFPAARD